MSAAPSKSKPLRILHVVFSLDPGGMENGLANLTQHFDPDEFDTHVCCLEREGSFASRFPKPEQIYTLQKSNGFSIRSLFGLIKLIWRIQPHVIHSHNLGTLIYASTATAQGRWKPILHGEHGQLAGEHSEPRRVRQRMKYFPHCRALHTVSHSLREHFSEFGFAPADFRVIVNGVDTERFQPGDKKAARRELGLQEDAPTIGMLGRFGPYKRHDLLLKAFEEATARVPDAQLLVVGGSGPEEDNVKRQANESRVADRIWLTGFQDDPRRHYHAMDLLVIPSINEGLSNALLEAMASGVPALCNAAACGSEEVISPGEDGFITEISTSSGLAKDLADAMSDPARLVDMGRTARKNIEQHFSIEKMVSEYQRIYRELAHGEA
jgi:glycosyltransferase involved in cell wall biosynthesis